MKTNSNKKMKTLTQAIAAAQTQNWKMDKTCGADMKPVYLVETASSEPIANTKDLGVAKLLMAAPALAAALKMFIAQYEGNGRDEREQRPEMQAARKALAALSTESKSQTNQ